MEPGYAYANTLPHSHRVALREAIHDLIDTTIADLGTSDEPSWTAENWLIGTMLPARYRPKYDGRFARRFFVCLTAVVWKLGQREVVRPSCVAEELAIHILILEAETLMVERGEVPDFADFRQRVFEDLDFEFLYDDALDGIERADIAKDMGIANLAFADWFIRFGHPEGAAYTEVHPYAQNSSDF